jgi:transcriptional regulator with XRE-family HTH domain
MTHKETTMKSFGHAIKSLRVAKDLSLRQAASLVGVTDLYLDRIEESGAIPPGEVVKELAKALETDEDTLLQLWRSSYEQPVDSDTPTEPKISQEAEEHEFFWH